MTQEATERSALHHIERLVDDERRLLGTRRPDPESSRALHDIRVELDRCWDLLRQRRALREAGRDLHSAALRSIATVEGYEG